MKQFLERYFTNIEVEDFDHEAYIIDEDVVEHSEQNGITISSWLADIIREAEETVQGAETGDRDNLLENRPFAKYFIDLCQILPIWGALSNQFFNSPNFYKLISTN